ncbi:MAG: hypothetical protein WDZ40_03445 [Candidatus Spechtbacterales bacterium]
MFDNNLNLVKSIFLATIIALLFMGITFFISSSKNSIEENSTSMGVFEGAEEIKKIKSTQSLDEQVMWYTRLIERVGPENAQEFLYYSGLPFDGQSHLLNHTSGESIYEKFGTRGLIYCKDYFLSSCYHGFLIRAIGEGGMNEVEKSMEECSNAGWNVFAQCSHAVGHGFLAYVGYANLLEALALCDSFESRVQGFPVFNCHDGVFMENIWAAHEGGEKPPDRWVKESEYDYPCSDPRIEKRYLEACWSNQPALMYEFFEGDVARVGEGCETVKDTGLREMCFNGLARQIHPVAMGDIEKVFGMCGILAESWRDYCLLIIASSDFGVGGRDISFEICNRMNAQNRGEDCYEQLLSSIKVHAVSKKERTQLCEKIENVEWRDKCF